MEENEVVKHQPYFSIWNFEKKIGSGAFGDVYSIYHDDQGVRLYAAMKVLTIPRSENDLEELRSQGMSEKDIRTFFQKQVDSVVNEIEILKTLRGYDHIVCYEDHEVLTYPDQLRWDIFIRMEKLEVLGDYLRRIRATRRDIIQLWYEIASTLVVCHKRKIIHRDIKPDNILVSKDGYYKLADFGIARNIVQNFAGTTAGTYSYMAPEVQQRKLYNQTVDIYSLGIVIYQLFNANRYPFLPPYPQAFTVDQRDVAIAKRFSGRKAPAIPKLPVDIMRIIWKSIEFNPARRYASAENIIQDLKNLRISDDVINVSLYDSKGQLLPVKNQKKRSKGISGATFLLAIAVVLLLFSGFVFALVLLKS